MSGQRANSHRIHPTLIISERVVIMGILHRMIGWASEIENSLWVSIDISQDDK